MYTLLLAFLLGLVSFLLVAVFFDTLAAFVPGILVFLIAAVVLLLRRKRSVDAEMQQIVPMLQRRDVDGARRFLREMGKRQGPWMPMLGRQIEAQLGMLDYFQLRFDEALPRLEKGSWQNWMGQVCIGAIHFRKKRLDEAWKWLEKAVGTAPKEDLTYVVYAILATRAGDRDRALSVLDRGLKKLPESVRLKDLYGRVANKKKIKTAKLGEAWFHFFPEDLAAQAQMANRRGGPMPGPGFQPGPVSKQQRRGR